MKSVNRYVGGVLRKLGYEIRRVSPEKVETTASGHDHGVAAKNYSFLDEQSIIAKYARELKLQNAFCVDIGAGDGIAMSNTYALYLEGWSGLAVEFDAQRFAKLAEAYSDFSGANLAKCKVTPQNVLSLFEGYGVPEKFGFLALDIDGYDYFVLEQVLSKFRPSLICTEINEKIPTPVKFTVRWDPGYAWQGDHCYGQSISQLHLLCARYSYSIVELEYNNAFLIPAELSAHPALTPEEAYNRGYKSRADRKEKFPWNENVEKLLSLPPEKAVSFINVLFAKHEGKYLCSL